jgi:hypothetical protein
LSAGLGGTSHGRCADALHHERANFDCEPAEKQKCGQARRDVCDDPPSSNNSGPEQNIRSGMRVLPRVTGLPSRPNHPKGNTSVQQASTEKHCFFPGNAFALRQGINIWEEDELPDREHQSPKAKSREEAESPGWSWFNILVH